MPLLEIWSGVPFAAHGTSFGARCQNKMPAIRCDARPLLDILLAAPDRFEYPKACATERRWREPMNFSESNQSPPSALARVCVNCPVCRRARRKQKGLAFWLVKKVEGRFCWFGRAYERAFGRKPHEPIQP
jgi:hypothetical protein